MITVTEFTPIASTVGGLLIGTSAALLLVFNGRIAGISGIVGSTLGTRAEDRGWRLSFLVGLLLTGIVAFRVVPEAFGSGSPLSTPLLVVAGLAVGFGTRLGSGCTSGHGVCGMSRMSTRSFVATGVFMAVAAVTVLLVHGGAA